MLHTLVFLQPHYRTGGGCRLSRYSSYSSSTNSTFAASLISALKIFLQALFSNILLQNITRSKDSFSPSTLLRELINSLISFFSAFTKSEDELPSSDPLFSFSFLTLRTLDSEKMTWTWLTRKKFLSLNMTASGTSWIKITQIIILNTSFIK